MDDHLLQRAHSAQMLNYGERAYARAGSLLWNDLPLATRDSPSPQVFKSKVNTVIQLAHFCHTPS